MTASSAALDRSDAVPADRAGVRIVRGALGIVDGSGAPFGIRIADPMARVPFDLRRVA